MMPFSDVFAPDVNFVSARSVYPTASGGSLASASGAMSQQTTSVVPDPMTGGAAAAVTAGAVTLQPSGNAVWWWVGFLAFLLVMVWVARKAGGEEDFRNIRPTFYNFFAITLTAIVGIVGLKVIFSRFRVPGASDIILAV